ncbi:MPPED1 [Symbiodinium microadriaticum]|nr:MPPED1 [Symbiodinium microadriaticum]
MCSKIGCVLRVTVWRQSLVLHPAVFIENVAYVVRRDSPKAEILDTSVHDWELEKQLILKATDWSIPQNLVPQVRVLDQLPGASLASTAVPFSLLHMLHVLFQEVDESRNGQISFSEFLAFCKKTRLFDTADKASEVFFSKRSVPTASEILFSDHDIFRLSSSESNIMKFGEFQQLMLDAGVVARSSDGLDEAVATLKVRAQIALQVGKGRLVDSSGSILNTEALIKHVKMKTGYSLTLQVCKVQVRSTLGAFAAILGDGSVVTWGSASSGGDSSTVQRQLSNVQQIQASSGAFAAVLGDGSVVTWGSAGHGGDSSAAQDKLKDVQQVQASSKAFAAILGDGSVVSWGCARHGGDSSAVQDQLKNVWQIQASRKAFAATLADGAVVTWGGGCQGGDSSVVGNQLRGVQQIKASEHAFAAILNDGSVVTWGASSHGSDSSAVQDQLKNVQQIQATRTAFAAILGDGAVVTWGNADHGGDSSAVQDQLKNVKQVQANDQTFAAILGDGSVVTWGGRSDDRDCSAAQHLLKNVQQISATGSAFAAILRDGSVVTWGNVDNGGDSSAVQDQLKNVQDIQASYRAFAAVLDDGSVVTWGDAARGGDSSTVQKELQSALFWKARGSEGGRGGGEIVGLILRHWFAAYDSDGDGVLQLEDYARLVADYQLPLTASDEAAGAGAGDMWRWQYERWRSIPVPRASTLVGLQLGKDMLDFQSLLEKTSALSTGWFSGTSIEKDDEIGRLWRTVEPSQQFVEPSRVFVADGRTGSSPPLLQGHLRFVCLSDTHGQHRELSSRQLDVNTTGSRRVMFYCTQAGDFSTDGSLEEVLDFAAWIRSLPYAHKLLIAGNHDLPMDKSYRGGKALVPKHVLKYSGVRVYGTPWQPEFMDWAFNLPRHEIGNKWKAPNALRTAQKGQTEEPLVRFTARPWAVAMRFCPPCGGEDLLTEVQERIRPQFCVFGHIHEGAGVTCDGTTHFVNASSMNEHYQCIHAPLVFDS